MYTYFSKKNRALLSELVRTDFKLRYQDSVLGYLWSLLRPLLMFVILYVVFTRFLRLGSNIEHYKVYLLLGIVLWNFFNEMTMQSVTAIVARGDLLRKISIPRWIIVLSSGLSALINLALNMIVIVFFMIMDGVDISTALAFFPLLIIEIFILGLGLSLFLSAAYVRFRDLNYIWEVVLQAGFYLAPVIYPLSLIHNVAFQKIVLLNPISQIIQDARFSLVNQSQTTTTFSIFGGSFFSYVPYAIVIVVLVIGTWYFRKYAKSFAENV